MNIQLFDEKQVAMYEEDICQLLHICIEESFSHAFPEIFYAEKIESLKTYLKGKKAYLFAALTDSKLMGFLWACELYSAGERKLHVLYFAVRPDMQGCGIGSALLYAAEKKAKELGIPKMELRVSADNTKAVHFYDHCSYKTMQLVLEKVVSDAV